MLGILVRPDRRWLLHCHVDMASPQHDWRHLCGSRPHHAQQTRSDISTPCNYPVLQRPFAHSFHFRHNGTQGRPHAVSTALSVSHVSMVWEHLRALVGFRHPVAITLQCLSNPPSAMSCNDGEERSGSHRPDSYPDAGRVGPARRYISNKRGLCTSRHCRMRSSHALYSARTYRNLAGSIVASIRSPWPPAYAQSAVALDSSGKGELVLCRPTIMGSLDLGLG